MRREWWSSTKRRAFKTLEEVAAFFEVSWWVFDETSSFSKILVTTKKEKKKKKKKNKNKISTRGEKREREREKGRQIK